MFQQAKLLHVLTLYQLDQKLHKGWIHSTEVIQARIRFTSATNLYASVHELIISCNEEEIPHQLNTNTPHSYTFRHFHLFLQHSVDVPVKERTQNWMEC